MARTDNPRVMDEAEALRLYTALCGDSAGSHNALFRGKCLGNALTAEQSAAIKAQTFDNIFIGDYWTMSGTNYRVAHCNYWYLTGDTSCTTPHVVLVPDKPLYTAAINSSNTADGGYVGSDMYKTGLAKAKEMAIAAFGKDHILTHREYLTNAVSNGIPSNSGWYNSDVELPNENMCYGSHILAPTSNGTTVPDNSSVDRGQLMLFALRPDYIHAQRDNWCWLRDVVSAMSFAAVSNYGYAGHLYASNSIGVRPVFAIY